MAKIGDIFANWARGDKLNHAEIEQMRRTMNDVHAQSRRVADRLDDIGGLSSDIFSDSGSMSVLPHESGGVYSHTDDIQSVPPPMPIEIDGGIAHKTIEDKEADRIRDATIDDALRNFGFIPIERIDGDKLLTQEDADAVVSDLF